MEAGTAEEHAAATKLQAQARGSSARNSIDEANRLKERQKSALSDVEGMQRAMEQATKRSPWVIDPNVHEWTQWWDLLMMVLLTVILFMTPYEVAFLKGGVVDGLFVVNRLFDAVFITDLLINFFLAYQSGPEGTVWIKSLPQIRTRYLKGWFLIDLLSVLPFWLVSLLIGDEDSDGGDEGAGATDILRAVRAVRLLRLIKLSKVLGMSRILKRYETHMDITYASIALVKIFFWVIAWSHLQACLWGLIPLFEAEGSDTWLGELAAGLGYDDPDDLDPWLKYTAALYFSVMTLTSIGYGAMLPPDSNPTEKFWCVVLMLTSSMMWVYTMGQMCAVATAMDPDTANFHNRMDALNLFMRERALDKQLRVSLRGFFHASRRMHRATGDISMFEMMSPQLRGTVALASNREWLERVWYLSPRATHLDAIGTSTSITANESESFIAQLAMQMKGLAFVRAEALPVGKLYILRKGLCCRGWSFMGPGRVWGEDLILEHRHLIQTKPPCTAMTYIEVLCLERDDLMQIAREHPTALLRIKKAARRMTLSLLIKKAPPRRKRRPRPPAAAAAHAPTARPAAAPPPARAAVAGHRDGALFATQAAEVKSKRYLKQNSGQAAAQGGAGGFGAPVPVFGSVMADDDLPSQVRGAVRAELKEALEHAMPALAQQLLEAQAQARHATPAAKKQVRQSAGSEPQEKSKGWGDAFKDLWA